MLSEFKAAGFVKPAALFRACQCYACFANRPQHMRNRREPEARRHADARSESRTVQTRPVPYGPAPSPRARLPRRYRRRRFRVDQRLVGIHRAHLELRLRPARKTVQFAQLAAHLREQRVLDRQREIVDANARRVELAARAAHRDQRLLAARRTTRSARSWCARCRSHRSRSRSRRRAPPSKLSGSTKSSTCRTSHAGLISRDALGHRARPSALP